MNILAVGAHFDDLEMGCGGTLIKHVQKQDKVTMLVVTDSAYNNPVGIEVRNSEIARAEGEEAAKIIGADLICLRNKTFFVAFDEDLTKVIVSYVRDLSIDTVYFPWVHDLHRDHQYTAKSAMMASRHVPRILMYRSNFYDTEHKFGGNMYSDISDVMDKKMEVIKANESELKRVGGKWLDILRNQHENDGYKIGVKYAECFEAIHYLI